MNKSKVLSVLLATLLCVMPMASIGFGLSTMSHSMNVLSTGLNQAIHVVKGPDDKLYISEYGGGKISRMDLDGNNLEVFSSGLNQPIGMFFDSGGNLYVAEHAGSKVVKITPDGTKTSIKEGVGILTGLVIDSGDKLYAVEYGTGKILKMNLDGSGSSDFVTGLGSNTIIGMTIDSNDNIYVSDRSGGKIKKIAPDTTVTDFITGLSTPTWITLGKDGFFYTSLGSRKIEKYDLAGQKLDDFLTPSTLGYPWGSYIDETGAIYYQTLGSGSYKIIGIASTVDKTHLTLTLNTSLEYMTLDPGAFTISGVASNPAVTQATTSGSSIFLILDKAISYTDTATKVTYAKTGVNNLLTSGSAIVIDNFNQMPVKNNVLRVTSVSNPSNINVDYGTDLNTVKAQFPATVTLNISDMTTDSVAVTWDDGTPAYNPNVPGNYTFTGTFETGANVSNSSNFFAVQVVSVSEMGLSNNATLSSLGLSEGTLAPVFDGGTLSYTVSVPNIVSSIRITPTLSDLAAQVTVNGTLVTSGEASAAIPLNVGANVILVSVTAEDAVTNKVYTLTVQRQAPIVVDVLPTPPSPTPPVETPDASVIVIVNGQAQSAGKETKTTEGTQNVVTVEVDNKVIESKIEEAIKNNTQGSANVLQVPVANANADIVRVQLSGDIVKKLESNAFDVSIKRGNVEYVIPASEFTISKVAEGLSVLEKDLQEIKIEVQITNLPPALVAQYNEVAKANGAELIFPPIAFEVIARTTGTDGKTEEVAINKFSNYVERLMEVPENLDPTKITTGIVFNDDGTYSHVPTEVFLKDGKWYARLSSLTNSTYSLIWNPVRVNAVEKHWSKNAVNDMASRLVVFNPEGFSPNKAITRGDFAEYMVRALGLYQEGLKINNTFKDVNPKSARSLGILIANQYGLVTGYSDGTFKPDATITREEAMVMYQRAMKVSKLVGEHGNRYEVFTDFSEVSSFARESVKEVLAAHVFNGSTTKLLSPKKNLTYAEAIQAIKNLLVSAKLINQ